MQKDFHYYATAVLARAAGFGEEDALTIGYAAQYVDDATNGETILVAGQEFEPKFTANDTLHHFLDRTKQASHRKVYIPFHFLPQGDDPDQAWGLLTVKGNISRLAREMMAAAEAEPRADLRLCRLGLGLHVLSDTWAHQGFSGRWHRENDLKDVDWDLFSDPEWMEDKSLLVNWAHEMLGHTEVGPLADYGFATWDMRFELPRPAGAAAHRDNPAEYLEASREIFNLLCRFTHSKANDPSDWTEIETGVKNCIGNVSFLPARCRQWRNSFSEFFPATRFPDYDITRWEKEALGKPLVRRKTIDLILPHDRPSYPGSANFPQSKWALFHQAAGLHRDLVRDGLGWPA